MSVIISWTNRVYDVDEQIIYRRYGTEGEFTSIATLGNRERAYIDKDSDIEQAPQYRLGHRRGSNITLSDAVTAVALRAIPGSEEPIAGDADNGYFGTIPIADFPALAQLIAGSTANIRRVSYVHKFIRKGKILYIPDIPLDYVWMEYPPTGGNDYYHHDGILDNGRSPAKVVNGVKYNIRNMRGYVDHFVEPIYATALEEGYDQSLMSFTKGDNDTEFNFIMPTVLQFWGKYSGKLGITRYKNIVDTKTSATSYGPVLIFEKVGTHFKKLTPLNMLRVAALSVVQDGDILGQTIAYVSNPTTTLPQNKYSYWPVIEVLD